METNPFRAYRGRRRRERPADRLRARVATQVAGRSWRLRAPLLLVFAWMLHRYLGDPAYSSIFAGVNLGFHEAGHAAFTWFGSRVLTVAGGTIFQLGIPVAAGAYLLRAQRDPFGAAVCLFWLGTALVGAGVYAADARAQALPLVSPFGPVDVDSHDWTFMLMKYGLLTRDQEIGAVLGGAGLLSMTISLLAGAWVLRVMATTPAAGGPTYADASEDRRFAAFLRRRVERQRSGEQTDGRGEGGAPASEPNGPPLEPGAPARETNGPAPEPAAPAGPDLRPATARPAAPAPERPPVPRYRSYLDPDEG